MLILGKEDIKIMLGEIEKDTAYNKKGKMTINVFGNEIEIDDTKLLQVNEKIKILNKGYLCDADK